MNEPCNRGKTAHLITSQVFPAVTNDFLFHFISSCLETKKACRTTANERREIVFAHLIAHLWRPFNLHPHYQEITHSSSPKGKTHVCSNYERFLYVDERLNHLSTPSHHLSISMGFSCVYRQVVGRCVEQEIADKVLKTEC